MKSTVKNHNRTPTGAQTALGVEISKCQVSFKALTKVNIFKIKEATTVKEKK